MPVSIQVRGREARALWVSALVDEVYADLRWVDATFSRWRPDSELSRLRRGEVTMAQCCPEMTEVWNLCEKYRVLTDGAFMSVLPDEDSGRWLIDPTGLVKGWALARAAVMLRRLQGHAYCVNGGGDIVVGGRDEADTQDRPWRLGVEDPDQAGHIARVVELRDGALATSGCAARGAHLVDPVSGERRWRRGSVSVVAPDIIAADVWATALFVGPADLEQRIRGQEGWEVIRL
ncbi:hypothetical protein KEM60_00650 [Austwickia sp. TVS 96-490-7B]|nr:hypothetical protein [Austwickia sp. TVS 96-490-7B]